MSSGELLFDSPLRSLIGTYVPPVPARPQGLKRVSLSLNRQDSDGRPQQRPHLLRQLRHWRIQIGAACLEGAASPGGAVGGAWSGPALFV